VLDGHPNHVRLFYFKDDQGLARLTPKPDAPALSTLPHGPCSLGSLMSATYAEIASATLHRCANTPKRRSMSAAVRLCNAGPRTHLATIVNDNSSVSSKVHPMSDHYHAVLWIDHHQAKVFHFDATDVDRTFTAEDHMQHQSHR
jgi:hypothetical protein